MRTALKPKQGDRHLIYECDKCGEKVFEVVTGFIVIGHIPIWTRETHSPIECLEMRVAALEVK